MPGFDFYKVKEIKKFQNKKGNNLTLLIIFIEQSSTNQLL
jgi:hypothetical protein